MLRSTPVEDEAKLAKNRLENYCVTVRNTHTEEKLKGKFEAGEVCAGCFGLAGQESFGRER